eukprot:6201236-Pleurochrysis_carterae.AAC.1
MYSSWCDFVRNCDIANLHIRSKVLAIYNSVNLCCKHVSLNHHPTYESKLSYTVVAASSMIRANIVCPLDSKDNDFEKVHSTKILAHFLNLRHPSDQKMGRTCADHVSMRLGKQRLAENVTSLRASPHFTKCPW